MLPKYQKVILKNQLDLQAIRIINQVLNLISIKLLMNSQISQQDKAYSKQSIEVIHSIQNQVMPLCIITKKSPRIVVLEPLQDVNLNQEPNFSQLIKSQEGDGFIEVFKNEDTQQQKNEESNQQIEILEQIDLQQTIKKMNKQNKIKIIMILNNLPSIYLKVQEIYKVFYSTYHYHQQISNLQQFQIMNRQIQKYLRKYYFV